jgi:hypothetical protein
MMTDWYQRSIKLAPGPAHAQAPLGMPSVVVALAPAHPFQGIAHIRGHPMPTPGFLNIGLKRPRRSSQSLWVGLGVTAARSLRNGHAPSESAGPHRR